VFAQRKVLAAPLLAVPLIAIFEVELRTLSAGRAGPR
jgi:hypothetical protein